MNKKQTSFFILSEVKENENLKKRYKKLTFKFFSKNKKLYDYIKISILIQHINLGLKAIAVFRPNQADTGFIFKPISAEKDFQLEANKIIKLYEKLKD